MKQFGFCIFSIAITSLVVTGEYGLLKNSKRPRSPVAAQGMGASFGIHKRIIGGQESRPNHWPWMVDVRVPDKIDKTSKHKCGGALIDEEWVLTAAHCFLDLKMNSVMRLGEHDQTKHSGIESDHKVKEIHFHDAFLTDGFAYDIALIKISPPAKLNQYVKTIPLPPQNKKVPIGTKCILTGWGQTAPINGPQSPVLRQVEQPIVSYQECAAVNDKLHSVTNVNPFSNICAGDLSGKSGCNKDSGGPLVCRNEKGNWILQGIVSWGDEYCRKQYYGVFTRVSFFITWIQNQKKSPPTQRPTDCSRDYHWNCSKWKKTKFCGLALVRYIYCPKTCGVRC